ncbi:putative lipid-transfer protein DIR1 [Bienertia sinuspersici]
MLMIVISMVMMDGVVMQGSRGDAYQACGISIPELVVNCILSVLPPPPPPRPPTVACCNTVKKSDLKCLCKIASSPLLPSFGIDRELFLALFGKCGLPSCS